MVINYLSKCRRQTGKEACKRQKISCKLFLTDFAHSFLTVTFAVRFLQAAGKLKWTPITFTISGPA